MLLKRLTLHGFKTFASRTVFEFEGGITAIIGPNGSGKSNLADAVRWVLGEASHLALRSKKTEDVIFAGGRSRPAMGMAEVSLTLDNRGGLLATDFAEVTITRRAYRDGETHYLINGARARLKDILELTAPLGGSYTVVGQGLVDLALSQRPEERRGLFEHAAGITAHQLKRAEAERRLAAAEANCQRLSDILAELTPRLRTLERQARQASEAATVDAELTAALGHWHGARWRALRAAVEAAETTGATLQARLDDQRAVVARQEADWAGLRQRVSAQRAALDAQRAERASLSRDLAEATRRAAVAAERVAALQRRLEERAAAETTTATRQAALEAALAEAADRLTALTDEEEQSRASVTAAEAVAAGADQAARQAEAEIARLRHRLLTSAREIGRIETAQARLHERQAGLEREAGGVATADRQRAERQAAVLAQQATLRAELAAHEEAARDHQTRRAALAADLAGLDAGLADQQRRLRGLDHDLTAAQARLEALTRLRESGAGLASGPKAVLAAARAGRLTGVLGAVAALVGAPAHLETALEVALGGHVQDIVVTRWAEAEAAIDHLKRSGAGRATFQPLDTLRPPRPLAPLGGPGLVGPAASLVTYDPRFGPLVEALLGRVLIVEDLATARRLVSQGSGWTIVTLAGEITRPGGAVTGGAAVREAGVLARERELRELPARVHALSAERAAVAADQAASQAERAGLAERVAGLTADLTRLARETDRLAHAQSRAEADLAALAEAAAAATQQRREVERRQADLGAELERQQVALSAARAAQAETQAALEAASAGQADLGRRRQTAERAVSDARAARARLDERRRAAQARQADLLAERERLTTERVAAAEGEAALQRDLVAARAEHATQADRHHYLARDLAAAEAAAAPTEAALATDLAAAERLEGQLASARATLLTRESEAGQAAIASEQARGDLAAQVARLDADLPGVDPATLDPTGGDDPRLVATIATLRERLRRVGLVDPGVIAEHAATRDRHAFLTRELADVETAARTLRTAIADLDTRMRQRFDETFQAVNLAFGRAFSRLFNGGTARLLLSDDGAAPGIDIVAQPPGKRPQSLTLLSGGERALTAAALLFGILEVNPSPFCLLDEVDAALDESNVARFRDLLAELASRTQFVVITHNRGTIEGADTLYGISMGQDGVSQVISLRLEPAGAG